MSTTRDIATQLLVLGVIEKRISAFKAKLRAEAMRSFDRIGVRDIGLVGDEQIGSVQLASGASSASITDEAKYTAWVSEQFPDAIEEVTVRRVKFHVAQRHLSAVKSGNGLLIEETGELLDEVPGITRRQGDPVLKVATSKDADVIVSAAVSDGTLTLADAIGAIEGPK